MPRIFQTRKVGERPVYPKRQESIPVHLEVSGIDPEGTLFSYTFEQDCIVNDAMLSIQNAEPETRVTVYFHDGAGEFIYNIDLIEGTSKIAVNTPFNVKIGNILTLKVFHGKVQDAKLDFTMQVNQHG